MQGDSCTIEAKRVDSVVDFARGNVQAPSIDTALTENV